MHTWSSGTDSTGKNTSEQVLPDIYSVILMEDITYSFSQRSSFKDKGGTLIWFKGKNQNKNKNQKKNA